MRGRSKGAVVLGLVADLHGRLDPRLAGVLAGVDRILVAGDTVDESLIARLEEIAPVLAVRGNNDRSPGLRRLPEFLVYEGGGRRVLVAHDAADRRLAAELRRVRPGILVVGHSHVPLSRREAGLWTINPGSAGPKRFRLPRTAGTLRLSARSRLRLWDLERNAPFRWPGTVRYYRPRFRGRRRPGRS